MTRTRSTQKLPMVLAVWRAIPLTSAAAIAMPVAALDEIMKCQPHHLREVRHGGFADVALPIRVGGETCRGVERQIRANSGQALRI